MKKMFMLLFAVVLLTLAVPYKARANDGEILGMLDVKVETGDVKANVVLELTNLDTGVVYNLSLPYAIQNHYGFITPIGTYRVTGSKVRSTDNKADLEFRVEMEDVTLDLSNPNGDWTWYAVGKLVPVLVEPTKAVEKDDSNSLAKWKLPEDNAYFPNMTIPEIQQWYVDEVTAFLDGNEAYQSKTVESYTKGVAALCKALGRNDEAAIRTRYRGTVDLYKEEFPRFYEAQKKIHDFIKDYYDETGSILNFNVWTYSTVAKQPEATPTPAVEDNKDTIVTIAPTGDEPETTPTPVSDEKKDTDASDNGDTKQNENDEETEEKEGWFTVFLKQNAVTLLILTGILIWGAYKWVKKKQNEGID